MNTTKDDKVAIMMATYNGADYIQEQLESLLKQSYQNWTLYVRDDGSTDGTQEVLEHYQEQYQDRIIVLKDIQGGGSSKANFALIWRWVKEHCDFSYFMFCDQDDYWLENKIEQTLELMKINETEDKPYLLHTDLKVVDGQLNVIDDSFAKYRNLNMNVQDLNHLLIQNNVTGCTMLWNQKLNDMLNLDNESVAMHDWWMAVVASIFGEIIFIPMSTVLYRQHGGNVVGATEVNSFGFILNRLKHLTHVRYTLRVPQIQAKALIAIYSGQLERKQQRTILAMADLNEKSKIKKIIIIFRNHFFKQGLIQIIGELLFI